MSRADSGWARGPRARAIIPRALLALALSAVPSRAQEFAEPSSGVPPDTPHAFLERAWPARHAGLAFQTSLVRWSGVAELDTRATALAWGRATWRMAAGASQSGAGALASQSAAVAVGHATPAAGIGLRGIVRREPAALAETPLGRGVGLDVGAGVWIRAADGVRVWASAPQAWSRGAAPALRRPLAFGASAELAGLVAWIERTAPAHDDDALGSHALGARLEGTGAIVWCELQDRPVRGSLGVEASVGSIAACARIADHPVLGETVHVSLRWGVSRP